MVLFPQINFLSHMRFPNSNILHLLADFLAVSKCHHELEVRCKDIEWIPDAADEAISLVLLIEGYSEGEVRLVDPYSAVSDPFSFESLEL
jgi:hypothetical protein